MTLADLVRYWPFFYVPFSFIIEVLLGLEAAVFLGDHRAKMQRKYAMKVHPI